MIFDLIRLVLVSRQQTSLFEIRDPNGQTLSREEWLRSVFKAEIVFGYRKQRYHFVPVAAPPEAPGGIVAGKVGRQHKTLENEPPEAGFEAVAREPWIASLVLIDPSSHDDGQKLAFEFKPAVGQAVGIIKALGEHINSIDNGPYLIEANAIAEQDSFWDFEKKNRGEVVSVSFELVAPNMFGIREAIDEEMKELRDNEKVVTSTLTLKNPNGLELETERVKQTVNYTMEGGGSIKARAKKAHYNSENKVRKVAITDLKEIEFDTVSAMIGRTISGVFGYD